MRLYGELAHLWPAISPADQYGEEAALVAEWIVRARGAPVRSFLELGSGAGHLASQLPREWDLTLVDRAPEMLALGRALVPSATHVEADLRSLDLGRTFDAVLLHDAVMYLTSEGDLASAFVTAARHLEPGGVLLVLPDVVKDEFEEMTLGSGSSDTDPAVRLLEWHWDPDPGDDTYAVEFALLVRGSDGTVTCHHDRHTMGLFERATWIRLLRAAGFALLEPDPFDPREGGAVFLARRT
jgi:SAM-dependent methyltransferase